MPVYYPRCLVRLEPVLDDFGATETDALDRQPAIEVIPESAAWESRPPGEAGTATVAIPWRDLPLDPRTLRDVRLSLYVWDAGAPTLGALGYSELAQVFVGFVDEPESAHGETAQTVTLSARDYQGRLMDTSSQTVSVRADRPLSACIRQVIDESGVPGFGDPAQHPAGLGLAIRLPDGDPTLQSVTGKSRWTPPPRASAWDVIAAMCRTLGMRAGFRLGDLIARRPQPIDPERVKLFVYGQNVRELRFRRDLRPYARKGVRAVAWAPADRRLVEATYPDPPPDEVVVLQVEEGAWTPAILRQRAEALYHALGEREMTGHLDTVVMEDLDEATLTTLRSGDVISVRLRSGDPAVLHGMSRGEIVGHLIRHGVRPGVAEALVDAWLQAEGGLATVYAVDRAAHEWSAADGYRLGIDFRSVLVPQEG